MNTEIKPKKCRQCPKEFVPFNSLDACCSPKCKMADKKERENKKLKRKPKLVIVKKVKVKKKSTQGIKQDLKQYTQDVVNAYIKVRDLLQPCISCGALGKNIEWQSGHFRTIGAAAHLRYNFDNIHKQCKHCNEDLSGNREEMEKGMVKRIGKEKVEALKNNNEIKRYTPDYLKRVRKIAALKKRKLERAA